MMTMTTIDPDTAADRLASATTELEQLQTLWDSLIWWERDAVLTAVFDLIFDIKDFDEHKARCETIQDIAEELSHQNSNDYPSEAALRADDGTLLYMGNPRLNRGQTIDILKQMPEEEIAKISAHIGTDADPEALISVMDRSMSAFYAIRNKVGDIVMQTQSHHAQAAFKSHYKLCDPE